MEAVRLMSDVCVFVCVCVCVCGVFVCVCACVCVCVLLLKKIRQMCINGESSSGAKVISGVHQGTVLGPLLLVIFINGIENV